MSGSVNAGDKLTSAKLGVPPWTAMTLINSWVNFGAGQAVSQYRKWALLNSVEVIGVLSTAGHSAATFFTLPAGFIPASIQAFAAGTTGGSAAANICDVTCDASGNLSIQNIPTGATIISFHGWISLDA